MQLRLVPTLLRLLFAASVLLISACSGGGNAATPTPLAQPEATAAPTATIELPTRRALPAETGGQIVAEAKIVPQRSAELGFLVSGIVAEILVEEGDTVRQGTPLLRLDTSDLELVVRENQTAVDENRAAYERYARLTTVDEAAARLRRAEIGLERAQLALENATLRAPFDGTVVGIAARVGEIVDARQTIATIADLSAWYVRAEGLSELRVTRIRPGDPALITIYALPDVEFRGKVTRITMIGQTGNPDTTYMLYITPDTWDERLRWNMTASVSILSGAPVDN